MMQDHKLKYAAIVLAVSVAVWLILAGWGVAYPSIASAYASFLDWDKSIAFAAWTTIALLLDLKAPNTQAPNDGANQS